MVLGDGDGDGAERVGPGGHVQRRGIAVGRGGAGEGGVAEVVTEPEEHGRTLRGRHRRAAGPSGVGPAPRWAGRPGPPGAAVEAGRARPNHPAGEPTPAESAETLTASSEPRTLSGYRPGEPGNH